LDSLYRVGADTFYDEDFSWGGSIFQCRSHDPLWLSASREDSTYLTKAFGGLFRAVGYRKIGTGSNNSWGDWSEMRIGQGEAYLGVYNGLTTVTPADDEWTTRIHLDNHGNVDILADNITLSKNVARIWGVSPTYEDDFGEVINGSAVEAFQAQNENGNTVVGWGNYEKEETSRRNQGNTNIYGQDVYIGPAKAGINPDTGEKYYFKPYFRVGDTVNGLWYGTGYISSAATKMYFTIPLAKPVVGDVDVLVEDTGGFTVRQYALNVTKEKSTSDNKYYMTNCTMVGKYIYGSSASQPVAPKSLLGYVSWDGNSVRVVAEMEDTTDVINNTPCGIAANLKFTFIEKAVG
jgi:hypothetical protein